MSRAYRALVRVYPRSFRDAFGDDMVQLFEDQRADEPALRVWCRALADLAVSVPVQHLEVIVHHRPQRAVSSTLAVLGFTLLFGGIVIGSVASPLLLMIGAFFAVTGIVMWQQHRDVVVPPVTESWWKVLLAGPALLVLITVLRGVWPESLEPGDDLAWLLTFSGIMLAIALIAAGVLLGAMQAAARLNRRRA